MRKESDEDDEFYDRTLDTVKQLSTQEKKRLEEEAKSRSYAELKKKLTELLEEKHDISSKLSNMSMENIDVIRRKEDDELDQYINDNSDELRSEEKKILLSRYKEVVDEIEK